ncbi:MAG: helix-turn-helix domain-containing protein [Bacillota bacterium]
MFRGYCKDCKETISFWPEFVMPYQREPLETHESVVLNYLAGKSFVKTASEIGYDPRTVARWVMRIIKQSVSLGPKIIARVLKELANSILPLLPVGQRMYLEVAL